MNNMNLTENHVFLIEKIWMDPMENHDAVGYEPYGFSDTEENAKTFCGAGKVYTRDDCWAIMGNMPEYKYRKIQMVSNS